MEVGKGRSRKMTVFRSNSACGEEEVEQAPQTSGMPRRASEISYDDPDARLRYRNESFAEPALGCPVPAARAMQIVQSLAEVPRRGSLV